MSASSQISPRGGDAEPEYNRVVDGVLRRRGSLHRLARAFRQPPSERTRASRSLRDDRRERGRPGDQRRRRGQREAVPPEVARHVRGRSLRAREPLAPGGLPDARPRTREHRALLRARRRRLVHDDGARPLRRHRRAGRRGPRRGRRPATPPARPLEARDRQRVPHRPRAGALEGRREHRGDHRRRQADGRPRPPAVTVPDRGSPERARAPPRQASVRDRRPVVRQPLAAKGRTALLDERQRRRQVGARDPRPRHPARLELRPRERSDRPVRCRRTSSRGACRSTRSSTG